MTPEEERLAIPLPADDPQIANKPIDSMPAVNPFLVNPLDPILIDTGNNVDETLDCFECCCTEITVTIGDEIDQIILSLQEFHQSLFQQTLVAIDNQTQKIDTLVSQLFNSMESHVSMLFAEFEIVTNHFLTTIESVVNNASTVVNEGDVTNIDNRQDNRSFVTNNFGSSLPPGTPSSPPGTIPPSPGPVDVDVDVDVDAPVSVSSPPVEVNIDAGSQAPNLTCICPGCGKDIEITIKSLLENLPKGSGSNGAGQEFPTEVLNTLAWTWYQKDSPWKQQAAEWFGEPYKSMLESPTFEEFYRKITTDKTSPSDDDFWFAGLR